MSDEQEKSNDAEGDAADDLSFEPDADAEHLRDPLEQIKKLKERLVLCQKERQEYLDGWQRVKADFVNAKRREEEERNEFLKFSRQELIKELLPALNSFHTAFGNKETWEKVDLNWRMGVQHIYSQLRGVLERHGIALIEPKIGEPFDPGRHASIGAIAVAEKEKDHTIAEVVQKGYALHGKILEPAQVKVGEYRNP
ncbi:MAG: molecular chaperone GrpE [Parcubacteria group bacterium Greene0416_79]|nr:MAG: molecular chaperone GrpE [Parcubacteria group bacterium Greene0416_79]